MLFRFDLVRAVLNVDITNWMKKLPHTTIISFTKRIFAVFIS
jgi:hypothetical protein